MVLEVLDAVLTQPVLPAADESADQVFGLLRHVSHLLGELESLLGGKEGRSVKVPGIKFKIGELGCGVEHTLTMWFMIFP